MLIPYCQSDKRWGEMTLGRTNLRMKSWGCACTSIAILDGRSPDIVLDILNKNNCFTFNNPKYSDGTLLWGDAARFLGMQFDGFAGSEKRTTKICIAETRRWVWMAYCWRYLQHFFIWLGDGSIIDPIDGREKLNKYRIFSYRLFYPKEAA